MSKDPIRQAADKFANDFRAYLGGDLETIDTQELAMRAIAFAKSQRAAGVREAGRLIVNDGNPEVARERIERLAKELET